jgi:DNA polymerase I-like protein with 3'-5' exonuclease and polymerase domains
MNKMFGAEEHETIPIDFPHEVVTKSSRALEISKKLMGKKALGVDTETTGLDPHKLRWIMTQICDGKKTYLFDMRQVDPETLRDPMESNKILKIIQHIPFDYNVFKKRGIIPEKMFCTSLAEQVLSAGITRESNLAYLVRKYMGFKMDKETRSTFKDVRDQPFTARQIKYAVDDAAVLPYIYKEQVTRLKQENLGKIAMLEFACAPAVAMMEYNGIGLNVPQWKEILVDAEKEQKMVAEKLIDFFRPYAEQLDLFGNIGINLDSQDQLKQWFKRAGFDLKDTKDETIKSMAINNPIFKVLREYRKHTKILTAYGDSLLERIHEVTGRLHPDIRQLGARSGRFSFNDPNLQQVPGERKYRHCFSARPGFKTITADYSQQELRIAAHASGDPVFIQFFKDDMDVHCRTAEFIYGVPWQDILAAKIAKDEKKHHPFLELYNKHRGVAKNVSFLILYGGTPFGLAAGLGIDAKEAEDIFKKYFAPFVSLDTFIEKTKSDAITNRYAINLGGRKRFFRFPEPHTPEFHKIVGKAQRIAVNHMIQSTAADIMKLALSKFYRLIKDSDEVFLLLSVHDEIVVEAKEDIARDVERDLVKIMEDAFVEYCPSVPIKVDSMIENYWTK